MQFPPPISSKLKQTKSTMGTTINRLIEKLRCGVAKPHYFLPAHHIKFIKPSCAHGTWWWRENLNKNRPGTPPAIYLFIIYLFIIIPWLGYLFSPTRTVLFLFPHRVQPHPPSVVVPDGAPRGPRSPRGESRGPTASGTRQRHGGAHPRFASCAPRPGHVSPRRPPRPPPPSRAELLSPRAPPTDMWVHMLMRPWCQWEQRASTRVERDGPRAVPRGGSDRGNR